MADNHGISIITAVTRMNWLETRLPPPLVLLLCALLAWLSARFIPFGRFELPFREAIVAVIAAVGIALNLLPKILFQRAGTTVNPLHPARSSQLVTTGIYRYSRNPMYLGQALLLLACCLWWQHLPGLLVVPAFVLYITRFQILPEERQLSLHFAAEFQQFRNRTRRWL